MFDGEDDDRLSRSKKLALVSRNFFFSVLFFFFLFFLLSFLFSFRSP